MLDTYCYLNPGSPNVQNDEEQAVGFFPLRNQARRTQKLPTDIRNEFCRYFVSPEGQVSWPIPYH